MNNANIENASATVAELFRATRTSLRRPTSMNFLSGHSLALFRRAQHLIGSRARPITSAPPITGAGFDFVTVVFARELDLLALQARSMERFLDPRFAGRIVVIVNDLNHAAVTGWITANVVPLYGRWRRQVVIVPLPALGHRLNPTNGWLIQQALKLSFARFVARPHYVVLDAKNHLVAPTSVERFVDLNGLGQQAFANGLAHLPRHDATCASYFGLEATDTMRTKFAPMTPFVFHTQSVRDLVAHIETRENCSVEAFFCDKRLLSEFMLYGAYLEAKGEGIQSIYSDTEGRITVWPYHDERKLVAQAEASKAYCFGVHREHLAALAPMQLRFLEKYWRRIGLLGDNETLQNLALLRAEPITS